jgi:hypothetical protein
MILVSISRRSGMFQYSAIWSAQAAKAHPAKMLILLQLATTLARFERKSSSEVQYQATPTSAPPAATIERPIAQGRRPLRYSNA